MSHEKVPCCWSNKSRKSPRIRCQAHGAIGEWLASSGGSLAITTYTSGRLVLLSSFDGQLQYRERRLARPMGIAVDGSRLAIATQKSILQFRRRGALSQRQSESVRRPLSDAVFVPEQEFVTGKLDAHDIAFGKRGLYFANTRFNCVARASLQRRFVRSWQPSFISGLISQDRCHLNGIGLEGGQLAMATAFCETSHADGWREQNRFASGVLIDVRQGCVVARGLCMPHSPRRHNERWWLCNSGYGTLAIVDLQTGECQEVCSLPGFTRGLCFVGSHALVGLSKIRREHVLDAPPVRQRHAQLYAGVALVDLAAGRHVGTLEFVQGGREVFDIAFLPGIRRPNVILGGKAASS